MASPWPPSSPPVSTRPRSCSCQADRAPTTDPGSRTLVPAGTSPRPTSAETPSAACSSRIECHHQANDPRWDALWMRVMVADDAVLFREGLSRVLADAGFEVTAKVADGEALL